MEQPHKDANNHTPGNDTGSGGVPSTDVVPNDNLEIHEHDEDARVRSSEINDHQTALSFADTGNNKHGMEIEDVEIGPVDPSGPPPAFESEIVEVDHSGIPPVIEPENGTDDDDVYVAVGEGSSSYDALSWTLRNIVKPRSNVYLIHVFPEVHQIPSPLGYIPKHQATKDQVDNYMNQEKGKMYQMLQRYVNLCIKYKVKHDVHLIESSRTERAILEFIPVLQIQLLVMGTSKSNMKRLKRGGTKAGIVQKNAPLYCEVKIICEGKEIISTITGTPDQTPPVSPLPLDSTETERKEPTLRSSISSEHVSTVVTGSTNPREENIFKKILRFFSCKFGMDRPRN